ncbi:MAG: hypothetical protein CND57_00680 [SAR92 bacterium MED-G29]|nr:hypothetical protein [Porticoccaceae bacterium]PDH31939.1 MAG: hypothetical protein CND57_00680 [SAR92 bacterium MED-G29]
MNYSSIDETRGEILKEVAVVPDVAELAPELLIAASGWSSLSVALLLCLAFSVGAIATYLWIRKSGENTVDVIDLQKKLVKSEQHLKQYQQEVSQHFITISHLTASVTQSYRDINEQLVSSAMRLASPEIGRQLLKSGGSDLSLLDPNGNPLVDLEDVEVPRDYAPKVPGGILSEEYGLKDEQEDPKSDRTVIDNENLAIQETDPTENVG